MMWGRRRLPVMPAKFEELAAYNTRVSKGIAHQAEYEARMAKLQAEFDRWMYGIEADVPAGKPVIWAQNTTSAARIDQALGGDG